uniref:Uncharacterized protein n=1 Tax=Anguilla anguilla TaxID=7936 RepID=A0A0E9WQ52_ANGAN
MNDLQHRQCFVCMSNVSCCILKTFLLKLYITQNNMLKMTAQRLWGNSLRSDRSSTCGLIMYAVFIRQVTPFQGLAEAVTGGLWVMHYWTLWNSAHSFVKESIQRKRYTYTTSASNPQGKCVCAS